MAFGDGGDDGFGFHIFRNGHEFKFDALLGAKIFKGAPVGA